MTVDPNLTLQAAIDRMCTLCDSHRDCMLFGYFTYNGFPWQCDEPSRINILGTILFALTDNGNLPAGFVFRDMNNQNHQVTGQQMIMMAVASSGSTNPLALPMAITFSTQVRR